LEIVLDKKDTTNASIKIRLNEADYQPKVTEKLKEYTKKASIKGFRPGKVPPALIKKMFGKSIMIEEINQLLVDSVNGYIKENELPIVGDPLPDKDEAEKIDWDNQKEFEFSYAVGLVSDFDYDLQALNIQKYEVEVTDEQVEQTISNLQKRYGEYIHPEESAEEDFLVGDLKAVDGDFTKEGVFLSLNRVKPELRPQFIGKKKGDTITFDLQNTLEKPDQVAYLTGVPKEEAEKLTGDFILTVTDVERMQPAVLEQAFFDKVLGPEAATDENSFREKIKSNMQEIYVKDSGQLLLKQIKEQLVQNTAIELPGDFLRRWLVTANKEITAEQVEKEFDDFIKELKWDVIKNRIAKDAEIKVEHNEVIDKTKAMIREQFGMASLGDEGDDRWESIADNFLKGEKGKNYMNVFNQVYADKVTGYILEQAPSETKKVKSEEFVEISRA
jgi:trigger factor